MIEGILLKKNLPHVITVLNSSGDFEELHEDVEFNIKDIILGMAELNSNDICLLDIHVGKSKEGTTKIKSIEYAGIYKNEQWIKEPVCNITLPEGDSIFPFKSDSWALGELIVRLTYGKTIPSKFMKSQTLLDKFVDSLDFEYKEQLKKILVLDPYKREFTWNIFKEDFNNCTIQ